MQFEFSAAAEADIVDIAGFVARANPAGAITSVDELESCLYQAARLSLCRCCAR